jgi:hypothetical protein
MRISNVRAWVTLFAVGVAACGGSDKVSTAPTKEQFVISLNGASERPNAVTSSSTGSAVVQILPGDSVEFVVYVKADSILASHIHAGDANVSGPIMVFTFGGPVTGPFDGALAHGFITRQSQFSSVFTYDSLVTRLRAGTSYLNVHTRKFPGGEIRGQLVK